MYCKRSPLEVLKERNWFKKKKPRILIVIDYENLRFLLDKLNVLIYPDKIGKSILDLLSGSKIIRKSFYAGVFPEIFPKRQEVFDIFSSAGFKLMLKAVKIQGRKNGRTSVKGDLDVDITVDVMMHTFGNDNEFPDYDLLLFFGGDGDYARLFERVVSKTSKQILIFSGIGNFGLENLRLVEANGQAIQYINIAEIVEYLGVYNYKRTIR